MLKMQMVVKSAMWFCMIYFGVMLLLTGLFAVCIIGCSDPSVPYSGVWEDSDDTTSPDGGSDEPSDEQPDGSDTDLSSVPTDSASITSSDSGSGDTDTGTATASDTESETATVEDTVTATDSATASETVSTGSETSNTGETSEDTSTGVTTNVDTGSETTDTGEDTEGEWQDPSTGLIWETFLEPYYAPPGSSYSNMKFRCENKGMRIPTGPEARTLMVNCDGYFIPDCEWEDATGYYHCQSGGIYDPDDCNGPSFLNDRLWNSNEYIMTSSEIGDEGRHLQWFLSKDYEADPLEYPRMFTKDLSGGGFYTICVK